MYNLERVIKQSGLLWEGILRVSTSETFVESPNIFVVAGERLDNTNITAIRPFNDHVLVEYYGKPKALIECGSLVEQSQYLLKVKQELGRLSDQGD